MLKNWKFNVFLTIVLWTVANIFLKYASDSPNSEWRINTMFWMLGSLFASLLCAFTILRKHMQKPTKANGAAAIAGVICSISIGVASVLYTICDASKIAPIMGLATPLSGVVCLLIFKEKITFRIILGLIVASVCIYLLG